MHTALKNNGLFSKKLPQDLQRVAERKLIMIHRAANINDLRVPPENRLEALSGNRDGNIVYASITNGAFVLNGVKMAYMVLKL